MNDQQLQESWQNLIVEKEEINYQLLNFSTNMEQEIKEFERRITGRNRKEIITAILLIVCLTILALNKSGYFRIGSILLIVYFFWIIFYLIRANLQRPIFTITKSIKDQIIAYKSFVIIQRNLVKNVLYWYLLPIIPGVIFIWLGMDSLSLIISSILLTTISFIYIYRLNIKAAVENYEPILQKLDVAVRNLEG